MSVRKSAMVIFAVAGTVLIPGLIARQRGAAAPVQVETKAEPATRSSDRESQAVLIELYTSEGCSSCPPADRLLAQLGRTQPVPGTELIVLEEHVDYWDRLGWKDPFSSAEMTARQQEYADAIAGGDVYTPQMVVDGRKSFVGSSAAAAMRALFTASGSAKPAMHLAWADDAKLTIRVDTLTNATPGDKPEVYLAVAESMLHSDVKRGENAGRALEHTGVVRRLETVGKADAGSPGFSSSVTVSVAPEWNRANLRAVVFVQERRSRLVLAAAAIPFLAK